MYFAARGGRCIHAWPVSRQHRLSQIVLWASKGEKGNRGKKETLNTGKKGNRGKGERKEKGNRERSKGKEKRGKGTGNVENEKGEAT